MNKEDTTTIIIDKKCKDCGGNKYCYKASMTDIDRGLCINNNYIHRWEEPKVGER